MGITYKLTGEVIDYIINLKKNNKSLSCRVLAEMASEKYQTKISKSSVNDVLKSAKLSSSVGRRSGEPLKSKKFTIPDQIKKNIRQNVLEKTDSSKKSQKSSKTSKPELQNKEKNLKLGATEEELENIAKSIDEFSHVPQQAKEPKEPPKPSQEDNVQQSEPEIEKKPVEAIAPIIPTPIEQKKKAQQVTYSRERKGHLYNGMGFILLKAAEWEVTDKSFLGNLFKKYVRGPWNDDFEKSLNALTILKMLGIDRLEDSFQYRYHALWRLNDFSNQPALDKIYDWTKFLESPQDLMMEYLNECRQMFLEVTALQFTLEDGHKIFFDPYVQEFFGKLEDARRSLAITKTLTLLSNFLVSTENLTVSHLATTEEEFSSHVWNLICAFENFSTKKIKSIEIISEDQTKISDFPVVMNKKRFFAFGIASWQREFKELAKNLRWASKKQYEDTNQTKSFYFTETKTNWFSNRLNLPEDHHLKLITFWQENSDEPFWMILTNDLEKEVVSIIDLYLKNYPTFDKKVETAKSEKFVKQHQEIINVDESGLSTVWDLFKNFGLKLHQYTQRHFHSENIPKFSINDYISDIYNLPGYLINSEKETVCILSLPPSFKYYQDLLVTIRKINQAQVKTHAQKSLIIDIDY